MVKILPFLDELSFFLPENVVEKIQEFFNIEKTLDVSPVEHYFVDFGLAPLRLDREPQKEELVILENSALQLAFLLDVFHGVSQVLLDSPHRYKRPFLELGAPRHRAHGVGPVPNSADVL